MTLKLAMGASVIVFGASALAFAEPTIDVGTIPLAPNQANQVVDLYVTGDAGGTAVGGINFDASTGGGGTSEGGTVAPMITAVNLKPSGGLFSGISDTQMDDGSIPQAAFYSLAYTSGGPGATITIPDVSTLLAQVTFDTTGLDSGSYEFALSDVLPDSGGTYSTDFAGTPASITNGEIIIVVPEPASVGILGMVGAALLGRWRR